MKRDALAGVVEAEDVRVTAVQKSLAILETVLKTSGPATLTDLAAAIGMPKASVHRLLTQLEEIGFVRRDLSGRAYLPGPHWIRLATDTLVAIGRQPPVLEIMRNLVNEAGESSTLAILEGTEILYVERVECDWPLRVQLQPGSRVPVHCTSSGKLLLSEIEPARRQRFIETLRLDRHTSHTITDPVALGLECDRIRKEGIALNREEYHLGLIGVAVPVRGRNGQFVAALAIHAPVFRMSIEQAGKMVPLLKAAASRIAAEAGLD